MTLRELLCKLGLHRWYYDSAFLVGGDRCRRCRRWKEPMQGAQVERFRQMVENGYLDSPPPAPAPTSELMENDA